LPVVDGPVPASFTRGPLAVSVAGACGVFIVITAGCPPSVVRAAMAFPRGSVIRAAVQARRINVTQHVKSARFESDCSSMVERNGRALRRVAAG